MKPLKEIINLAKEESIKKSTAFMTTNEVFFTYTDEKTIWIVAERTVLSNGVEKKFGLREWRGELVLEEKEVLFLIKEEINEKLPYLLHEAHKDFSGSVYISKYKKEEESKVRFYFKGSGPLYYLGEEVK